MGGARYKIGGSMEAVVAVAIGLQATLSFVLWTGELSRESRQMVE